MVLAMIYLDVEKSPVELVENLLKYKLISAASIDFKNELYVLEAGKMVQHLKNVITVQTKSLLFSEIEEWVDRNYEEKAHLFSIPIIASNRFFDSSILKGTKKI